MKKFYILVFLLVSAGYLSAQTNVPDGFVLIRGGTFTMGSPVSEVGRSSSPGNYDEDEVQQKVTVSSFYMSKYEVTQKEYLEVMRTNPSFFKAPNNRPLELGRPVENVSWWDAIEYCNSRSRNEGLSPAYTINAGIGNNRKVTWNRNATGYRLPTEAEWEYACRAGTTTRFNTGNNITVDQANIEKGNIANNVLDINDMKDMIITVHVGLYAPNAWDLYDMHGNVAEWCWDWYDFRPNRAQPNPALSDGDYAYRVIRGGSWFNFPNDLRSAYRQESWGGGGYGYMPDKKDYRVGFRVVRNAN